ncbi:DNA gyrase subunit A [Candidatus Woesearchaeota archaeon]|nr:DNA gyrase subunit A [Candidatus Woesearchaeota archaeon]
MEGENNNQIENRGNISQNVIEDEMKQSYLAYSMSVIVGRALPDVKDGLKPVHRRILYAMNSMGMFHNKPSKKSARIVGEVIGKYHPHGDTAVYDTMVRMAQDFSLRYPLINGQGNFGSIDGDRAAAMRYTEAKLNKIAEEMLKDLDKDTVEFVPNFDEELKEPAYLPCKIPNLLVNGSSGIAVGMATNIPPYNLTEVCEGMIKLIENQDCDEDELNEIIKGPDFPTGGIIVGKSGIRSAFRNGRGKAVIRSKIHSEEKNNKKQFIVDEIPYMVNKSNLLIQIANCVKEKKIEGITGLRDESDRDGMRIVIELKQGANEEVVKNQLYKHTRLQDSFGIIMLCLVNQEPKILGIKDLLNHFINHRFDVVTRRTKYELRIAQEKEHILKGLIIALDNIDEVIQKIKASSTTSDASEMLQNDYSLSDKQAKAILEMRLQKLSSLEQQKIRGDLEELVNLITRLQEILSNKDEINSIITNETRELIEKYGDQRKTDIIDADNFDVEDEDLIKEENMVVTLTHEGYIKRLPVDTYKSQNRGGKGIIATKTKEEDFVEKIFVSSTHSYLLIFTDKGKVYWKKVYTIPEASRTAKGIPIVNLIRKEKDEKVTAVIPVREFEKGKFLMFATKNGTVKRTSLDNYSKPRNGGIIALGLEEDDKLINVALTNGSNKIMIATKDGRAVKFLETDAREMGRSAKGVRGIKIKNSEVVGMVIADDENTLLTITNKGYGKRTLISDYRLINRGGSGVRNIKCTDKNGEVVCIKRIEGNEDIILISRNGIAIRTSSNNISTIGRNTQGVRVMKMSEDDTVVAVAKYANEEEPDKISEEIIDDSNDEEKQTENIYSEEDRQEQVEDDEITIEEEGVVEGYEQDESESFNDSEQNKVIDNSNEIVEEEIQEENSEPSEENSIQNDNETRNE